MLLRNAKGDQNWLKKAIIFFRGCVSSGRALHFFRECVFAVVCLWCLVRPRPAVPYQSAPHDMPLSVIERTDLAAEMQKADVLVFFASIDPETGDLWCSDCRRVQAHLKAAADKSQLETRIVYVGDKPTWKDETNMFRQPPFLVKTVPTVLRVNRGASILSLADSSSTRLEDDDCGDEDKLASFFRKA